MRTLRNFFALPVTAYAVLLFAPVWLENTPIFAGALGVIAILYMGFLALKTARMMGDKIGIAEFVAHITLSASLVIAACAAIYLSSGLTGDLSAGKAGASLYFSAVTFSTLGFGDITPEIGVSRAVAAVEALLGNVHLALFAAAAFYFMSQK